jgi:crotonobetainyl-CoA:carnitine CoA-transferase CaiB-like acyl-CoA transferase
VPMTGVALLDGVRVLELATGVAGPYAGKLFADYGADVVKVEPLEGDEARRWGPFLTPVPDPDTSALFLHLNTNKRSITLDAGCDRGRELAERLISSVDVVIESYRPGTLEAWGLGFEKMQAVNRSITLTSITPFGQDGPYRDYQGSEVVYWALAGMNFTREWDGRPIALGGNLAQYQAGNLAAAATMAALMQAEATGDGIHVDASHLLAQVGSASGAMTYLVGHAYTGRTSAPPRSSSEAPSARSPFGPLPNGTFRCADGAVMVSTLQAWVPRMVRVIGDPELSAIFGDAQRLAEPDAADRVYAIASAWFASRSRADAMAEAQAAGWPVTAVQSPSEVASDAHFRGRGAVIETEHPVAGMVSQPGPPFRIEGGWSHRRPAPRLGEHNREVFGDLGLTVAELSTYQDEQVI